MCNLTYTLDEVHSGGTEIGASRRQRRASFFRPSPTANLVGVEEGYLVWKVPFFLVMTGASARSRVKKEVL